MHQRFHFEQVKLRPYIYDLCIGTFLVGSSLQMIAYVDNWIKLKINTKSGKTNL